VHATIHDEFVERVMKAASKLRQGWALSPVGLPLISQRHVCSPMTAMDGSLMTASTQSDDGIHQTAVHVTNLTPGSECNPRRRAWTAAPCACPTRRRTSTRWQGLTIVHVMTRN
jgi:hypothetical protein